MLSIVIPTLESAPSIGRTVEALAEADELLSEVIVVDGGSADGTPARAAEMGARVVHCTRGRGLQLAEGAKAARGTWLCFLHADTVLCPGWSAEVGRFVGEPENRMRAAVFGLRFDDPARAARRLEAWVAWRSRRLGLPYGDQGLLISRAFYDALGGFKPMPLMEDVDMVRRIGRRRLTVLGAVALTSAERYRRAGYVKRGARNLTCLTLYFMGLDPRLIARLYG